MNIEEAKQIFASKEFKTLGELKNFLDELDPVYLECKLTNEVTGGGVYFMIYDFFLEKKMIEFN
ncbi:hypothetical protein ACFFH2_02605 [Enterococcus devriesei]|uniref:Uncharacterized protein n=1 Tax=Enterococcus devriesei TaxID=319970 RepID=A0A1L8SP17_9ENTE|nr:hypothetical protein [Enterococcus devriesei]OJG33753.1 hypothetical protein RV00_GL001007 [Enterococcus devriesei]